MNKSKTYVPFRSRMYGLRIPGSVPPESRRKSNGFSGCRFGGGGGGRPLHSAVAWSVVCAVLKT